MGDFLFFVDIATELFYGPPLSEGSNKGMQEAMQNAIRVIDDAKWIKEGDKKKIKD